MNLYEQFVKLTDEIRKKYVRRDREGIEIEIALGELTSWLKKKENEQKRT